MTHRPWKTAIFALCGSMAAASALGLGFGRMPDSTVFGQPFDLRVPLRMDVGEDVPAACVSAEVSLGDQRLPAASLQWSIERSPQGHQLRLRSPAVVLEPLVSVTLSIGCNGTVARQFVVFADPPAPDHAPMAAADLPMPTVAVPTRAPAAKVAVTPDGSGTGGARNTSPVRDKSARSKPARSGAAVAARSRSPRAIAPTPPRDQPQRSAARATPRLQLDEPDVLLQAAKLAVATQDAAVANAQQAASAAQAAASSAENRLLALQQDMQALRSEAAANRAAMEQLRARLAGAEDRGLQMNLLLALVALLGGVTLWLAWRLRALQRERQAQWWSVAQASAAQAVEANDAAPSTAADAAMVEPEAAPAPLPIAADADVPPPLAEPAPTRALSVDELIDLEQQADFFVVLGEDASAVDLLMTHLRGSGGVSPLPYLKLLEIYRRGDDRDAYERIRKRFNQRFNAVASSWEDDLQRGRALQDYPGVMAALQAAWPTPLDAMAELENLLFRKQGGELFELPAYRDVLTLYAVARDLHRRTDDEAADVDVLLPLGPMHEHDVTARLSIFDRLDHEPKGGVLPSDDRPTAPIDLDLSEPAAAEVAGIEVRAGVRQRSA